MTSLDPIARPVPMPSAPVSPPVHGGWSRIHVVFAVVALAAQLWAGAADAQLGDFVPAQPYWMGPIGGDGAEIQSGQIWIDVNGNDLTDATVDTYHPIPPGLASGWEFKLSPSRRVMIVVPAAGAACPGTPATIRLFSIPTATGAPFVSLGGQQTLSGCIQEVGFFDDPVQTVRTAYFREPVDGLGRANILWWNLLTGEKSTSPAPFEQGFGSVTFALSGTMAWVQHGMGAPQGTKYSLVVLCPQTIGQTSTPALTNQTQFIHAAVENGTSSLIVAARTPSNALVQSYPYQDCALPPPVLGACCLPNGGCLDGTTQTECTVDLAGTWEGAGSSCATADCPAPPAPVLGLTMTGPATGEKGAPLTYTLTARNDGTAAAGSVTVVDSLPLNLVFVSASNGGVYDAGRHITWSLGTLAPGASTQVTVTASSTCASTSVVNGTYRIISGVPAMIAIGTPAVTTTLFDASSTALVVTLTSAPQAAVPLHTGDRTRHTIQITNTLGQPRGAVRFLFRGGAASDIVQIINAAGGVFTTFGASMQWEGPIAASTTIQVVYETAIRDCRPSAGSTEQMNSGTPLVFSSPCGQSLGFFFPPAAINVAGSPFAMRIDSPTSPAQSLGTPFAGQPQRGMIVGRPNATVDLHLRFIRADASAAPSCSMSAVLPDGIEPASNPPFIGTPPAGTTWDAALKTVAWRGTPPANDSVVVAFRVVLGSGCGGEILARGQNGTCSNAFQYNLGVAAVPPPPVGPHLVGLHSQGLQTWSPGAAEWQPLLCGAFNDLRGVGRTPDGTLWVAGDPMFRINPATLSFSIFPPSFPATLGMDFPSDAAGDPRDSTVVFAGYQSGIGLRVRRYNPKNGQVTFILNDLSPMSFGPGNSVVVSADGTMGVQTGSVFLKIPAANPAGYQVFDDAGVQGLGGGALDTDGNYLVVEAGAASRRLIKIDRTSGAHTPLVDLGPFVDPGSFLSAVEAAPPLDAFVGDDAGGVLVVHRSGGVVVDTLPSMLPCEDLLFVDSQMVVVPPVEPPPTAGGLLELAPGVPNPFREGTVLRFSLPSEGDVTLDLYDLTGRRVRTLARGSLGSGPHTIAWDGHGDDGGRLGAGLYFVRLSFGGESRKTKLILAP